MIVKDPDEVHGEKNIRRRVNVNSFLRKDPYISVQEFILWSMKKTFSLNIKKNTTAEEIKRLEECGSNDKYYVLHNINLNTIGRLKVGSLVNTVNHSTTPNCEWKNGYLVAIRKIEHGEFLSVNYGNTEFGKRIKIDEQKEKIKQKNIKKITEQVRKEAKNNGGYIRNKSNGRFASYKKEIEKRLKNNK